jgi:hypothetical protein
LENFLDSIAFVRKIISSHRGVKGELDRPREVAVEEKMSIIFHSAIGGAVFINVRGVPGYSFCSGESTSYKPPCEGFDERWKVPAFPRALQDLICLGENAS